MEDKFFISYTTERGTGGVTECPSLKEAQAAITQLYWSNSDITNITLSIEMETIGADS